MAWPVIGKSFTPAAFKAYVDGLAWGDAFRPQFIALHNTAAPSLAQRPGGLTHQHILNLQGYYQGKGWGGGPHLFIDDKQIWVFNDLTKTGVHSPSWNRTAIGIEMLGDYERESFTAGRGLKVRANTVAAMAALNLKLGFSPGAFKFHIEDKKSDHACPGKLARCERAALVEEIAMAMAARDEPAPAVSLVSEEEPEPGHALPPANPVTPAALKAQGSGTMSALDKLLVSFGLPTLAGMGLTIADLWGAFKGTLGPLKQLAAEHAQTLVLIGLGFALGVILVTLYARYRLALAAREGRYMPRGAV